MKKVYSIIAMAIIAGLLNINPVGAAIFNYAALANSHPGEFGDRLISHNNAGVSAEARGFYMGGVADAYLKNGGAGLGVCHEGLNTAGQCLSLMAQNIATDEVLHLTFSKKVSVYDLIFKDSNYSLAALSGGSLSMKIDSGSLFIMSLDPANWGAFDGMIGTVFEFGYVDTPFYLASITTMPIPPAALLFATALIGLGWLSQHRKKG